MLVSLIIQVLDKATAPLKKISAATGGIAKAGNAAEKGLEGTARAARKIDDKPVGRLNNALRRLQIYTRRPSLLVVRTKIDRKALLGFADSTGRFLGGLGRTIGTVIGIGIGSAIATVGLLTSKIITLGKETDTAFATKFDAGVGKITTVWNEFLLKIGQAGVFDFVIAKLDELSAWIDRIRASGQLDKWAREIGAAMVALGEWIASINWAKLAGDVADIGSALAGVASFIAKIGGGGLSGIFNVAIIAIIAKISFSLYGLGAALGVVSIAGAPLWAVVAVIAAIAAGAFLIYRNWDKISAWFTGKWAELKKIFADAAGAIVGSITNMWSRAKSAFLSGVNAIWNSLPAWMRGIFNGATFGVRAVINTLKGQSLPDAVGNAARDSGVVPRRPAQPKLGNAKVAVGGALDIQIKTDKGTTARPTRLASRNKDVPINVGRVQPA